MIRKYHPSDIEEVIGVLYDRYGFKSIKTHIHEEINNKLLSMKFVNSSMKAHE